MHQKQTIPVSSSATIWAPQRSAGTCAIGIRRADGSLTSAAGVTIKGTVDDTGVWADIYTVDYSTGAVRTPAAIKTFPFLCFVEDGGLRGIQINNTDVDQAIIVNVNWLEDDE